MAQGESSVVPADLSVKWRIAIDKIDGEPEFRREKVAGRFEISNKQLCGYRVENRMGISIRLGHRGVSSCSERLPSLEALFARNQFLRVSQLKGCLQHLLIGKLAEPSQMFPDDSCDGIIPLAVPSQILFGLFFEVFKVRHSRFDMGAVMVYQL